MPVQFDLNAFEWFHPVPRNKWMVSIPNRQCMNINAALMKEIPDTILIGYCKENHRLAIREEKKDAFSVPRSGSMKVPRIITAIVESGVRLPARFTIEKSQDLWIGTLEEQSIPTILQNQRPKRSKGRNFAPPMKEADQKTGK